MCAAPPLHAAPRTARPHRAPADVFNDLAKKSTARGRRLPTQQFQSGDKYFRIGDARAEAAIIHNNFIIGADEKRDRFRKHGLWKPG